MKSIALKALSVSLLAAAFAAPATLTAAPAADRAAVDKIIAGWAERPRLGATQMLEKYGLPQEVTSMQLVWHKQGPFKRITAHNLETPHDFPLPHVDFLEHTIEYNVPQAKVGDLIAFDGSSTINRTVGELSARCDLEAHNVLTLNLDHDIVTGKKTVAEARKAFGEIVDQDVKGERPAYVEALQFKPAMPTMAAFSDTPVIPGSPVRANDRDADAQAAIASPKKGDGAILATVIAVDLNEVLAAAEAQKKSVSPAVMSYAKMLHEAHGAHMGETLMLGKKLGITPIDTASVEDLKVKGAGELAMLVAQDDAAFERSYVAAMVKGHAEVISVIDQKLLTTVSDDQLKSHLMDTREHVAAHLEKAKELQAGMVSSR